MNTPIESRKTNEDKIRLEKAVSIELNSIIFLSQREADSNWGSNGGIRYSIKRTNMSSFQKTWKKHNIYGINLLFFMGDQEFSSTKIHY